MRKLTIKRIKSFVGCLGVMKVYIEDPASSEMMINDIPCRKIGTLKNGEEKVFEIDEAQKKVFVIAGKMSKNYCSEFYNIPEGEEDVSLSGRNILNPAAGNAFRFDGIADEEMQENRKRGTKRGLVVLTFAIIVGLILGFSIGFFLFSSIVHSKDFSSHGMTITLTDEFNEIDMDNYTVCFESQDVAVFALQERFTLAEGLEDYTLKQYGNVIINNNAPAAGAKLKNNHSLTYFEYEFTNPKTDETYHYFSVVYKASDSFWMVQFATSKENYERYEDSFIKWAKSVSFSD